MLGIQSHPRICGYGFFMMHFVYGNLHKLTKMSLLLNFFVRSIWCRLLWWVKLQKAHIVQVCAVWMEERRLSFSDYHIKQLWWAEYCGGLFAVLKVYEESFRYAVTWENRLHFTSNCSICEQYSLVQLTFYVVTNLLHRFFDGYCNRATSFFSLWEVYLYFFPMGKHFSPSDRKCSTSERRGMDFKYRRDSSNL